MKPTNFAHYISLFIREYLTQERNYSPNTIKSYANSFVLLLKFIEVEKRIRLEKVTIEIINKDLILEFLKWLKNSRNSSDTTINNRLAAVHSFFKYLSRENIKHLSQCQLILSISFRRTVKETVNYMSPEAIKLLLQMPDMKNKKGRRDLALLSLLYDTGARVQELIDLTPAMIYLQRPMKIKVIGKGRKIREIPVCDAQTNHLKIYMKENDMLNPNHNSYPLFFNSQNEKLTRAGVNYILKFYLNKAKNIDPSLFPENISCHTLRHSKAMHLLRSGITLTYIRDIFGHSSVLTTEMYAKTDSKQKREALEKAYVNLTPTQNRSRWEGNRELIEWLKSY